MLQLTQRLFEWILRYWIERQVCRHFCAFRRAGSALKYTHVHLLRVNPQGAEALGHDDETDPTDAGHTTVSKGGKCEAQADDDESRALVWSETGVCAYFHPAAADGSCEPGFRRIRCRCRNREGVHEEVWVCYTLDHVLFERWYEEQQWPNRSGAYRRFGYTPQRVIDGEPGVLACGGELLMHAYEERKVDSCTGWGGAGDGKNELLQAADKALAKALAAVRCEAPCVVRSHESFRAWRCGLVDGVLRAQALVQWTVTCEKP